MKIYHKKSIVVLGIAAGIALATPLAAVETTAQQNQAQQSRTSMQERSTGQHAASSMLKNNQPRSSSDIIGMDIQSATGEKIGQIDDLIIDMESGKIVAVVVSTGGLLGAGARNSLLSTEDIRFGGEAKHLRTDLTRAQLQAAPRYRQGETSSFENIRPLGESAEARRQAGDRRQVTAQSDGQRRSELATASTRPVTETSRQSEADRARTDSRSAAYLGDADSSESGQAQRHAEVRGPVTAQSDNHRRNYQEIDATQHSAASGGTAQTTRQTEADRVRAESRAAADQRDMDGRQSAETRAQADARRAAAAPSNRNVTETTRQTDADRTRTDSWAAGQREEDGMPVGSMANRMALTDLVGMKVENRAGENIGSIDKLYVDLEGGQVVGAVVSTGGFLGMGVHQNILSLSEFDYNAGEDTLRVDMNREQLRSAPTYKKDDSSWHAVLRERSDRGNDRVATARTGRDTVARPAQTDSSRPTVFIQGNSSAETKMTADIRSAIRANKTMSSRANNVTIITQNTKVLLRGNVDSESEKTAIEAIARSHAGNQNVTSELVVRSR